MHKEFVNLYLAYLSRSHALSVSALAAMHVAAMSPSTTLRAKVVQDELGLTYQSALNLVKRLRIDGYLDNHNLLTDLGRASVGIGPKLPPLPGSVTNVQRL